MNDESGHLSGMHLPPFLKLALASLQEQNTANLRRSDVLKPLIYPLAMLVTLLGTGLFLATWRGLGMWVVWAPLALLIAFLMLYGGVYVFCLLKNPDALRSESYHLAKLAIENRVYGDSATGLLATDTHPALTGNSTAQVQSQRQA